MGPQPTDNDHYLTTERTPGGPVLSEVSLTGVYKHRASVSRNKADIFHQTSGDGFALTTPLTPPEARRIGEALIKAAEDADAYEAHRRWIEGIELDRQQSWEHEQDRMRDCAERGVEYPGPLSMTGEDLRNLQEMRAKGHTLPAWATTLLDQLDQAEVAA